MSEATPRPVRRAARGRRPAQATGRHLRTRRVAGVVGAALVLSGCGTGGPTSTPTGVDQLVVPTPTPRPQDYVAVVDNAWLAWRPGATTTYAARDGRVDQSVAPTTTRVAGLAATAVTTATTAQTSTDYFAQDRAGNVWWLGRQGRWQAGQDGAEAGLWMPASPRTGDGFRLALDPGVVEDIAQVDLAPPADAGSAYDEENLEDGGAGDEVRLTVRSDLAPGRVEVRTYVEGTGLVTYAVSGADDDTIWSRVR